MKSIIWITIIALVMAGMFILALRMFSEKPAPRQVPEPKQSESTVAFSKPKEIIQTTTSTIQTQAIAIVVNTTSNISDVVENSTSNILNEALSAGKTVGNAALGAGQVAIDAGKAVGEGAIDAGKTIGKKALDTGKISGTGTQNAIKKAASLFSP